MAFDWGSLIGNIATVGAGIYDSYQTGQIADNMTTAATAPQVDPFGAANRAKYQGHLSQLYNDPSYLQNLPSFKFAQQQGEKAINRGAAASGHFGSTNRLAGLVDYNQGLASQTYNDEASRLALLSGSQFAPNAGAYANLATGGQTAQAAQGSSMGGAIQGGLGALGDVAGGLGYDLGSFGGELGLPGLEGLGSYGTSALAGLASGQDPRDVAVSTGKDFLMDKGKTYATDALKSWFGGSGGGFTGTAGAAAAGNMAAGMAGGQSGLGLMAAGGPGGGLGVGGTGASSFAGASGAGTGTAGTAGTGAMSGMAGTALGAAAPIALAYMAYSSGKAEDASRASRMVRGTANADWSTATGLDKFGKGTYAWEAPNKETYYLNEAAKNTILNEGGGWGSVALNLLDKEGGKAGQWRFQGAGGKGAGDYISEEVMQEEKNVSVLNKFADKGGFSGGAQPEQVAKARGLTLDTMDAGGMAKKAYYRPGESFTSYNEQQKINQAAENQH